MDEICTARLQYFACQVKATRQCRGSGALDFDRYLDRASTLEYQVDLRTVFGAVVIRNATIAGGGDQIVDHECLPTRACCGMPEYVFPSLDLQQRMRKAAIADVNFRRAH